MSKLHDTGLFGAVAEPGGVRVCQAHRETLNDIFTAIKRSGSGRVSLGQFKWTVAVLCSVAVAFGLALWGYTEIRAKEVEVNARKIVKIESDLDYLKVGQIEAREEAKTTRKEMLEEFKRLREMIRVPN